jgi:hypothetical protein
VQILPPQPNLRRTEGWRRSQVPGFERFAPALHWAYKVAVTRLPANSGPAHGEKSALPMRQELRHKWIAAGYGPTMGSAEVVPPPPRGIRRVYYFTSAEFARDDIVHGRLKVARISELNDPFEFLSLNFRQMSERYIIDYF